MTRYIIMRKKTDSSVWQSNLLSRNMLYYVYTVPLFRFQTKNFIMGNNIVTIFHRILLEVRWNFLIRGHPYTKWSDFRKFWLLFPIVVKDGHLANPPTKSCAHSSLPQIQTFHIDFTFFVWNPSIGTVYNKYARNRT